MTNPWALQDSMWMFPAKLHIWYKAAYPICSMYGISTYKTGWFLGQMLGFIFQHHGLHMGMLWQIFSCECLIFVCCSPIRSILDTLPHCRLPSHLATSWLLQMRNRKSNYVKIHWMLQPHISYVGRLHPGSNPSSAEMVTICFAARPSTKIQQQLNPLKFISKTQT